MPFTKLLPSSIDLAQNFTFTGTVAGAGGGITHADIWDLLFLQLVNGLYQQTFIQMATNQHIIVE